MKLQRSGGIFELGLEVDIRFGHGELVQEGFVGKFESLIKGQEAQSTCGTWPDI